MPRPSACADGPAGRQLLRGRTRVEVSRARFASVGQLPWGESRGSGPHYEPLEPLSRESFGLCVAVAGNSQLECSGDFAPQRLGGQNFNVSAS